MCLLPPHHQIIEERRHWVIGIEVLGHDIVEVGRFAAAAVAEKEELRGACKLVVARQFYVLDPRITIPG